MDNKKFRALMTQHDGELKLNMNNIGNKSMELPELHNKYLDIYFIELKELKKVFRERSELYGDKYKHYKYFDDHKWDKKTEIETQILNDSAYLAKLKECDELELQVKQLEKVLDNIKKTSYTIRNIVDFERFKMTGL